MTQLLWFVGVYYLVANLFHVLFLILAARLIDRRHNADAKEPAIWPIVSLVVPAFNEQELIVRTTGSALLNPYPALEVVIINDGSNDNTFQLLFQHFNLIFNKNELGARIFRSSRWPNLCVIDKANGGRADALNFSIPHCKGKYILTVDADTFLEKDAIHQVVRVIESNSTCMGVGGIIRVLNGAETNEVEVVRGHLPRKILSMFQVVEYIRAFFGGRQALESIGGTALIPGAFSLFRKDALRAIGGFDKDSITEDFEIVVRMKRYFSSLSQDCEFHMVDRPTCWTIVPETLKSLFLQRVRWQTGLLQTLWKHKNGVLSFSGRTTEYFSLPYMLIFEGLSPLIELIGTILISHQVFTGKLSAQSAMLMLAIGVLFYAIISLATIRLEEKNYARHDSRKSRAKFIFFCLAENFGYRQFIFIARLWGTVMAFRSKPTWGAQDRSNTEERKVA